MMKYILERLSFWNVKYEKVTDNTLRVYGNFYGFSVVREAYEGWIEVDGMIMDYNTFEDWLYYIKL